MAPDKRFKLLHTALRMNDALDRLTEASADLDRSRTRLQKHEKQITDLITQALGKKGIESNSLLISMRHKFRSLRNTLAGLQGRFDEAHEALQHEVRGFENQLAKYQNVQAARDAEQAARDRIADALQKTLLTVIREREADIPEDELPTGFVLPEESHSYIPIALGLYLQQLIRVDEMLTHDPDYFAADAPYRPVSFLEIGCGTGRNLLIAKQSNLLGADRYTGFDLNDTMVRRGQLALGLQDDIFVANALEFDYGPYDVIFSYRPIRAPEVQRQLEERMVATMHPGAYVIAPLSEDLACYNAMTCLNGPLSIWKKTAP